MTKERFEEIFSKECITTKELAELFEISLSSASNLMTNIKLKCDRLHLKGKCHVVDYCLYFGIDVRDRYNGSMRPVNYMSNIDREDVRPHLVISARIA